MTLKNKHALYACINVQDTYYPKEIKKQTICIQEDIYKVIKDLQTMLAKDTNNQYLFIGYGIQLSDL